MVSKTSPVWWGWRHTCCGCSSCSHHSLSDLCHCNSSSSSFNTSRISAFLPLATKHKPLNLGTIHFTPCLWESGCLSYFIIHGLLWNCWSPICLYKSQSSFNWWDGVRRKKGLDTMWALLGSNENIPVLSTLFSAQIQNIAPYEVLWRKLTLSLQKPTTFYCILDVSVSPLCVGERTSLVPI